MIALGAVMHNIVVLPNGSLLEYEAENLQVQGGCSRAAATRRLLAGQWIGTDCGRCVAEAKVFRLRRMKTNLESWRLDF